MYIKSILCIPQEPPQDLSLSRACAGVATAGDRGAVRQASAGDVGLCRGKGEVRGVEAAGWDERRRGNAPLRAGNCARIPYVSAPATTEPSVRNLLSVELRRCPL